MLAPRCGSVARNSVLLALSPASAMLLRLAVACLGSWGALFLFDAAAPSPSRDKSGVQNTRKHSGQSYAQSVGNPYPSLPYSVLAPAQAARQQRSRFTARRQSLARSIVVLGRCVALRRARGSTEPARRRGKFIHLLATHGRSLEGIGDADGAIRLYSRGVDADPIVEVFHQGLMRCYERLGRHTEAISVYRRLRQTLSVVLGVSTSPDSQALHRKIMQACAGTREATEEGVVVALPRPVRARPAAPGRRRNRSGQVRNADP